MMMQFSLNLNKTSQVLFYEDDIRDASQCVIPLTQNLTSILSLLLQQCLKVGVSLCSKKISLS